MLPNILSSSDDSIKLYFTFIVAMQKILSQEQIRELDKETIKKQRIQSDQLMERAAHQFVDALPFNELIDQPLTIVAGTGNNGGDALAIARILMNKGLSPTVYFCRISSKVSPDCQLNWNRLNQYNTSNIFELLENENLPPFHGYVIDGLFGSGLNRGVEGYWATLIDKINQEAERIFSIDIPSGFFADKLTTTAHIQNAEVITFDSPKLSFLMPDSQSAIKAFTIVDIDLDTDGKASLESTYFYVTADDIGLTLRKRKKFSHKGNYGKVCILGGTDEMIGGVTLAGKAALATGAGYVFYKVPGPKRETVLSQHMEGLILKEAIFTFPFTNNKLEWLRQFTFGIGCAMGVNEHQDVLLQFMEKYKAPYVLDADALNMIAKVGIDKQALHPNSILTPHQKEFARLAGESSNSFEQLELLKKLAITKQLYVCLKGPHTIIACPDGTCYFNSTGNPGMAVAGSGDVLTGMITSFLSQDYTPRESAILGVYLHGYAGDLVSNQLGQYGLTASDIIKYIPQAINEYIC